MICNLFGSPDAVSCARALMAQGDHVEIGVFADYVNLSRMTPNINEFGLRAPTQQPDYRLGP